MQLELFAEVIEHKSIVIDEDQLLNKMGKRMFNGNDKRTVRNKLVTGDYRARFHKDGDKVTLSVEGYSFLLDARVSRV